MSYYGGQPVYGSRPVAYTVASAAPAAQVYAGQHYAPVMMSAAGQPMVLSPGASPQPVTMPATYMAAAPTAVAYPMQVPVEPTMVAAQPAATYLGAPEAALAGQASQQVLSMPVTHAAAPSSLTAVASGAVLSGVGMQSPTGVVLSGGGHMIASNGAVQSPTGAAAAPPKELGVPQAESMIMIPSQMHQMHQMNQMNAAAASNIQQSHSMVAYPMPLDHGSPSAAAAAAAGAAMSPASAGRAGSPARKKLSNKDQKKKTKKGCGCCH